MQQIRIRDRLKSRSKSNILARVMYKRVRNHVVKLINNAKSNYFIQQIMENKDNVKNLWKVLKRVVPITPLQLQPQQIEVDATGLDGISIRLLKAALPAISSSLVNIYNASITSGIFPDEFKRAKVTPCHKKESTHERGNFRPISVLSMLSKPLERHVSLSFCEHLRSHDLLYLNQSGFRSHHSCETALINITDKWLKAMDDGELIGAVFMDFSKAFDLVNHDVLLRKLAKYHISQQALQWFTSYLDGRSQQCSVLGSLSSSLMLERGVPQGSILGPILFSIYINDLPMSLGEANADIYADDTTLWSSSKSCDEIQQTLQNALDITE
ncbi:Hypothetical predicted protein [Paramuricea clavata]|uniref:Uncharacterized protein n=1 Tax=Paramuricea clavata TaxID=317549 RepID=A0A7D9JAE1_PARCT|nr:Hypothetical predicted protein [Paramuricea clavata]